MSEAPTVSTHQDEHRPTGVVQPRHEQAIRALTTLTDGRLADAEKHILALPDSPLVVQAWKTYLTGMLALSRLELSESAALLLQAAALAFTEAMGTDQPSDSESLRFCACALHQAGSVQRRQDRADHAYQTHLASYHLRKQHGSWEELWETAVQLGLDCDVARRHEDGQRWYRTATETADKTGEDPVKKRAVTLTHLATSLSENGQHQAAVDAARNAYDLWHELKPGSVEAARSVLKLGSALLGYAESIHAAGDGTARSLLAEVVDHLTIAGDELSAFGAACAPDVRSSVEQRDMAQRLLASVEL